MGETIELNKKLKRLTGEAPAVERIATGFTFTEGPVWDERNKRLIFSDIPGNTIYQWTSAGGHTVLRAPSGNTNGNTIDLEGRLISCEHSGRRVARTADDGTVETLIDRFDGKKLNSPNDVICTSTGDLIFTDPPYGLYQSDGTIAPGELNFNGVYRLRTDGSLSLLADDFARPNGLLLDSREQKLFVDDTERSHIRVFDIASDGSLKNGRVFAELVHGDLVGRPDGMKMDAEGNIYVAANTVEGIWVFDPAGELLGLIGVGEGPANLAWGGKDRHTLFVTANTSVYRISMEASAPIQSA